MKLLSLVTTLTVALLGACSVALSQGLPSQEVLKNWSLFSEYHKNGDFVTASPYGWNVARLDPTRFKTLYTKLAECYYGLYEKETLLEKKTAYADSIILVYDLGIKHAPEKAHSMYLLKAYSLENYFEGRAKEAMSAYEKAIELDFDAVEFAYLDRYGLLLMKEASTDPSMKAKAIELYRRAGDKDPANQTVVDRLKRLVTDPKELIELAEKKLATAPEKIEYLWAAAQAYIQAEQWEGAERHLQKLVKKSPNTAVYWNELGKIQSRQRRFKQAIESYESALKHNAALKENLLNIALCFRELKNFESARSYAQRAAQREKGWGRPYMEIGEIYKATVEDCVMNSKGGDWAKLDLNDKLVYRLAQESYLRAKAVESNIAAEADRRTKELSTLVPTKEDYFFHREKIKNGKMEILGSCYVWIREAATVPTR